MRRVVVLSACTEFLSHPIQEEKHSLVDHLLEVAKRSREIFLQTCFKSPELAFYSGLLHDFGKINPFYQMVFSGRETEEEAERKYAHEHSRFSAWAAQKLLYKAGLGSDLGDKISVLIYGHHSRIRQHLGDISRNREKIKKSQDVITDNLGRFRLQASEKPEFRCLNWESCEKRFPRPISFDLKLESKNSPDDFLEMSYAFSCMLQADRGSFKEWDVPNFDLHVDTTSQIKQKSVLGDIRTKFQKHVLENYDDSKPISIINAPTGIGKTKVFLDLISRYSDNGKVERMFYFSPLLALTEDFENKIKDVITARNEQRDILLYNHLYSEYLDEKLERSENPRQIKWVFENDSFNKKFVITTTQRLLMTIYSNRHRDKIKMASLRNSLLIIDEVQTIPKPILANLVKVFNKMHQYMGTRFILVSATIPHELRDVARISLPEDIRKKYLKQTEKRISVQRLDVEAIPADRTLVMANTRKKAVRRYREIKQAHPQKEVIYVSSGIRKKDRTKLIGDLKEKSDYILVSTQVVEAGVDINFSHVFREEAPLDNIIQVMGRLNREGDDKNACLVIYPTEGDPSPYSPLEYKVTQERIRGVKSSIELYGILDSYYCEISEKNRKNTNLAGELERHISRMDFDGVWKFVKGNSMPEDDRDTVFIPDEGDWEDVRSELVNGMHNRNIKRVGELAASRPVSLEKIGLDKIDEDLMEKNILLPKKQHLKTIYDENTGLDAWYPQ